ncbi:hypothetical protein ATB53_06040 [Xanthomonas translucens]|uniref:Uncharacterized protein n=2 Tax=Xanthomonas campestris pv. translucens TaxID=343 RepID=A0A109HG38_XANCT|nr:hypothetical protein OZ12_04455 [Xanthomonas translucens pv. translucens]KWV11548.1 hypothetical protein ATB53_06040 [Xanthomonas translucens]CCP40546.1 hypothetical protein BN444_02269 [Xanthomonas translucens pv. translucens DSM 18974]SCB03472.1 Conserved hypothetical protein [Xanthomonas translucens pv. translucens DSM 18974]
MLFPITVIVTHDIAPLTCTCIGDAFEWLVLMDILCFEEFECMPALSQLVPHVFEAHHSCQREFRLPGGSRFFLIHGCDAGNRQWFRATDIVCIHSSIPLVPGAVSREAANRFDAVARQGGRICLLYTWDDSTLGPTFAQTVAASAHLQWETPGMDVAQSLSSGLILSENWKEGIGRHAARTIANFMQTRARPTSPSVTLKRQQEAEA